MMGIEFEELYKLFFKDVYLYVLSLSSNPGLSEEITQETFFKAMKGLKSFKYECSVKTWLFQIAKNEYISYLRKGKRVTNQIFEKQGNDKSLEERLVDKDTAISIYQVLHVLKEPYKEVFTLRILGELSFKEIGEVFGKNETWARVTYYRAKVKIQDQLADKEKGGADHE